MNENFILVGRKCFSLDLTNLEDEFVDFFSSSPFSSDAVSSNVVYLCSSSGAYAYPFHSIAFEAIKNYTFFDILAKCAIY